MAIETEIAVAARDALSLFTRTSGNQENTGNPASAQVSAVSAPEEGVTLTLSAQGRLLAALAGVVDDAAADAASATAASASSQGSVGTAADAAKVDSAQAAPASVLPVTRGSLYVIEARLVAARRGADAVARADAELPPSNDPARLQQARLATESLYGRAANPFAGLSRADLSAIVYDESGAYTVNERYAAANQRTELDQRFWAPVFQRAVSSGDWRPVIEASLVFYAGLSLLEQTAYPANYVQLMRQYLALYNLQPQAQLPPQQQADLVRMMESLVLPSGPLALAGGVIRGLVLARMPSIAELIAAAPRLADILNVSAMAHSVQDSAYLTLLQRVFGVSRREDEPQVARRSGAGAAGAQARDYLSFGDRRYLADAYAWAQANGLSLDEVDALASDLAAYRAAHRAGAAPSDAARTDATQSPHYYRMSADDMAAAQRMLASRAARDTHLDHGFLAWLLDPGGGGWTEPDIGGHAVSFSALEKLLAALAGVTPGERAGTDEELEPGYRYAMYRIGLQDVSGNHGAGQLADGARTLTLAAQMAAMARSDAADLAFMNNALMLLKMYRLSLRMSDVEQRTLAELVYGNLRRRRARSRRGKLFVAWGVRSALMPSLPG